jgi:hypothetical protein|tara:strand:- start:3732 stop:3917 length:186 start_codon:yes stop_codon:yes gene_type:complete
MNETVKYRYRITILRSSGSVWVEDYSDAEEMINAAENLMAEYPHLVMSKQKIVVKDDEEDE